MINKNKRYILKKEYPGSPELRTIMIEPLITSHTLSGDGSEEITESDSANCFNEFWEEIVENDYEILSFLTIESTIINYSDLDINDESNSNNNLKIYSIKRLSDNEIFTIGDKIKYGFGRNYKNFGIIESFYSNLEALVINRGSIESFITATMKEIIKIKQKLFITEDNVKIFENDTFYTVLKSLQDTDITECKATLVYTKLDKYLDFSTEEKAKEYIIMNKLCLSINDISTIFKKLNKINLENLKELVKNKINDK